MNVETMLFNWATCTVQSTCFNAKKHEARDAHAMVIGLQNGTP